MENALEPSAESGENLSKKEQPPAPGVTPDPKFNWKSTLSGRQNDYPTGKGFRRRDGADIRLERLFSEQKTRFPAGKRVWLSDKGLFQSEDRIFQLEIAGGGKTSRFSVTYLGTEGAHAAQQPVTDQQVRGPRYGRSPLNRSQKPIVSSKTKIGPP